MITEEIREQIKEMYYTTIVKQLIYSMLIDIDLQIAYLIAQYGVLKINIQDYEYR